MGYVEVHYALTRRRGGRGADYVFERTTIDPSTDVKAGEAVTVVGESGGRVRLLLASGRQLFLPADDRQLQFLGPGYATHRSQGLTLHDDPIGILGSRNATLASAYVQISRAVHGMTLVTASFERLAGRVAQRDGLNPIATFSVRPDPVRDHSVARPAVKAREGPYDPSLDKPEPDRSVLQDRPLPSDRSL